MRPWQIPDIRREHWIVVGVTLFVVVFIVMLHHEALTGLARFIRWLPAIPRARIVVLIFCMLILHVIEICGFAAGYVLLLADPAFGRIEGPLEASLFDYVYYSVTVYTTLGFGDITPHRTDSVPERHGEPRRLCADHLVGIFHMPGNGETLAG